MLYEPYFCFSSGLPVRFFQKGTLEGGWKPRGETTNSSVSVPVHITLANLLVSSTPPQRPEFLLYGGCPSL